MNGRYYMLVKQNIHFKLKDKKRFIQAVLIAKNYKCVFINIKKVKYFLSNTYILEIIAKSLNTFFKETFNLEVIHIDNNFSDTIFRVNDIDNMIKYNNEEINIYMEDNYLIINDSKLEKDNENVLSIENTISSLFVSKKSFLEALYLLKSSKIKKCYLEGIFGSEYISFVFKKGLFKKEHINIKSNQVYISFKKIINVDILYQIIKQLDSDLLSIDIGKNGSLTFDNGSKLFVYL